MSEQISVGCVIMRGGTSKGVMFNESDLPADRATRANYLAITRDTQDAALRVRMLALARTVGWLSAAEQNAVDRPERIEIELEIRRTFPGHIIFRSALGPKLHDYQTVQITATAKTGKTDLVYEIVRKQGYNAKQSNVTLEEAEVKP